MNAVANQLRAELLTPAGRGAIAVIRLGGVGAWAVFDSFWAPARGKQGPVEESKQLRYGRIVDGGETLDDAVASSYRDHSGLETVDLTVHGGVRVVERVFMLLSRMGAAIGNNTRVVADSTTATAAKIESVVCEALWRARTRRAVRFLIAQRRLLRSELESISSLVETDAKAARERMAALVDRSLGARFLIEEATVAIVGPTNAGKSTLMNALFGEVASLTSHSEGTTLDWVDRDAAIEQVPLRVIDTAGGRLNAPSLERLAIARGKEQARRADVQVVVLDGSSRFPWDFLDDWSDVLDTTKAVLSINKSDLGVTWGAKEAGAFGQRAVRLSALTGDGFDALSREILGVLDVGTELDRLPALIGSDQIRWAQRLLSDVPVALWCVRIGGFL